ncbi:MAG: isoprenylcysteine carboxylmethyltransferase family protein [Deltaproteobacteria bacterium]|nr:isoprenylcysteine carboxylmethyltransferase family protein [Deltaproteobacteria bacterium]
MRHRSHAIHVLAHIVLSVLTVMLVILCFVFYNSAGLKVLLYLGWASVGAGGILFSMSHIYLHKKGKVEEGKGYSDTRALVDNGVYAIVRHPIFLGIILAIIGLILIAQHWLSVIVGIPIVILIYLGMLEEEESNSKKFGDAYERYKRYVPRTNFLLGIKRILQRKKMGQK